MNLVRKLALVATSTALAFGISAGCGPKKPDGTTPPGDTGGGAGGDGGAAASGDGGASADGGGDGGAVAGDGGGDGGAAAQGGEKCEAQVAPAPAALFGERVLIRPPINVEFIPDDNPTFAQAAMSGGFVSSCDATIKRITISVFENDKKKKLGAFTSEFLTSLEGQGFTGAKTSGPIVDTDADHHITVEYPAVGGNPPAKIYLATARRFDNIFVIWYESDPGEFGLLQPSFKASAESLLVVPPDA